MSAPGTATGAGSWHTVSDGETVARIAARYRYRKWQTIWDAPENAVLAARRRSPDILQPGDRIFIPQHEARIEGAATARRHVFVACPRPEERLILYLEDAKGRPLRGIAYELALGGAVTQAVTGPDGELDHPIPFGLRQAELTFNGRTWSIRVGSLDPVVDEDHPQPVTGARQRLENLAYGSGLHDLDAREALRAATVSFDHAVRGRVDVERLTPQPPADGGLDRGLRAALAERNRS